MTTQPTSESDLLALAKSLTPVQKRAVADGYIGDQGMATIKSLLRKDLYHLVIDSPNGRYGFMRLTERGDAVRRIIRGRDSQPPADRV